MKNTELWEALSQTQKELADLKIFVFGLCVRLNNIESKSLKGIAQVKNNNLKRV